MKRARDVRMPPTRRYGSAARALALALVCVSAGAASAKTVTWLHPTAEGGYAVESALPEAAASAIKTRVTDHAGEPLENGGDLKAAGYELSEDGFWVNHTRNPEADGRLNVEVSGLPPGRHAVYLRYFQMPRRDGDSWHYFPRMYFGPAPDAMERAKSRDTRIIRGTGTAEPTRSRNIYDGRMGVAGGKENAATGFVLGFDKYRWTDTVRYGSIRIESEVSVDRARTLGDTPFKRRMRARLLANGPEEGGETVYGAAAVSGTLKVRPKRFDALRDRELAERVAIAGARGEAVDRQVVVFSPERDLRGVVLGHSELKRAGGGGAIPASAIRFAPVGYVAVEVDHVPSEHGWWPEPILTFLDRFDIGRGDVQSLWYEVAVPRDAAAGLYRGTVTVDPENAPPMELPVVVRVWDFAVPDMPRLRVVSGINPAAHNDFLMEFGVNPTGIYGDGDFRGEEADVVARLRGWAKAGATAIGLGYVNNRPRDPEGGEPAAPDDATVREIVERIGRNYRLATEAGLRDAAYVYLYDEAGNAWAPAMGKIADALRAEFPDLLLLTTAHNSGHPAVSAVDGWCPLTKNIDGFRKRRAEAAARGRELWWYTCNSPPRPWANLFLTQPAAAHRQLMGFMAFAARTDGFLYYAFQGGGARGGIEKGPYTGKRASRDAHSWMYLNGPGGVGDPLPSLRMAAIRAGLRDYDYLHLAREARERLRAKGLETPELREEAEALAQYAAPGNDLLKGLRDYVRNPDTIEKVKLRLGAYIENASRRLRGRR